MTTTAHTPEFRTKSHILKCDGLDRKFKFVYLKNDLTDVKEQQEYFGDCDAIVFAYHKSDQTEFKIYPRNVTTLWLLEKLSDNFRNKEYGGYGAMDTRTPGMIWRKGTTHEFLIS